MRDHAELINNKNKKIDRELFYMANPPPIMDEY